MRRPVCICLGLGTSYGDHAGNSLLERYINQINTLRNVAVALPAGKEGNTGHHFRALWNASDLENQKNADDKLSIFKKLPIRHKCITAQPLIEAIDMEQYLDDIELVVVGGESDTNARPLDYDWVLDIREQCIRRNVSFEFRQCGTHFIKHGKKYKLQTKDLCAQARKADIDFKRNI